MQTPLGMEGAEHWGWGLEDQCVASQSCFIDSLIWSGLPPTEMEMDFDSSSRYIIHPEVCMPHRLKILIAEDSPQDAFLLQRAIEKAGVPFNPRFVTDGQEAVDYLTGADDFSNRDNYPVPSLVILDIKMPRLTGLDVLRWLKSQDILRKTPVVILSNSDEHRDVEQAYSLGANAYMVKPLKSERLQELVRAIDSYWREFCKLPDAAN